MEGSDWAGVPDGVVDWLLAAEPWTRYRTMTDLLDMPDEHPDVVGARRAVVEHPRVRALIEQTAPWFPNSASRHDDATLSHYRLSMLAELGVKACDPGVPAIVARATRNVVDSQLAIRADVPRRGHARAAEMDPDVWSSLPCDAPQVLYALLALGVHDPSVDRARDDLVRRWSDDEVGWFCHLFFVDSQFRKLGIGCPMAALLALRVFSIDTSLHDVPAARHAFAPLRAHRDAGRSVYYFGRSTKFWTLKYPFVWYNALAMADVVSRFPFARDDPLTSEVISWLASTGDTLGRYQPTSMYRAYSDWDFADKKQPSAWITLLAHRSLKRYHAQPALAGSP